MEVHLTAFIGVSALLIVTPGPDTALVTKNALLSGRRPALGTSFGVTAGC
jgi:threonine/homoserine/homoserine lactone efflux protein